MIVDINEFKNINIAIDGDSDLLQEQLSMLAVIYHAIKDIDIVSQEQFDCVTEYYTHMRSIQKDLDHETKKIIAPYTEAIKKINGQVKPFEEAIDKIISLLNERVNDYVRRKEIEKEENIEEDDFLAILNNPVASSHATPVTRTVYKYKIIDIDKVPRKYLMVNDKEIMIDMKLGVRKIDGLEVWEEKTTHLAKK